MRNTTLSPRNSIQSYGFVNSNFSEYEYEFEKEIESEFDEDFDFDDHIQFDNDAESALNSNVDNN